MESPHKIKHLSWINQKIAIHFPRIAEDYPVVFPILMAFLSLGYLKAATVAWPVIDQFMFDKPDSVSSGVMAYTLVIIPILCVAAASIIMMMNAFLTIDPFETSWHRYKPAITGIAFLSIGGCTVSINTAVFKVMGTAFVSDLGTTLSTASLFAVSVVVLVFCWPAQSMVGSDKVSPNP